MGTSDTLNKNDTQQKKDHLKKKKKNKNGAILEKNAQRSFAKGLTE